MTEKTITRRQFLKAALAAGGAVTAAGFLPGKWLKPVVQTGVLPAQAQVSGNYVISVAGTPKSGSLAGSLGIISGVSASIHGGSGMPISGVRFTLSERYTSDIASTGSSSPSGQSQCTPLPVSADTNASGDASFGDIKSCTLNSYYLVFTCDLSGTGETLMGPYLYNPQ